MLLALKNNKLPEIKTLIPDEQIIIFNNIDLNRHIISNLTCQRVNSITISIRIEKECNILSHRQS